MTLSAFTPEQKERVHALLALRVAHMMGRKMEEADWIDVYCEAKNIPKQQWSNLYFDIMHEHLGIEQKMLCYRSNASLIEACGMWLMHPSATRAIGIASVEEDANVVMKMCLNSTKN